MRLAWEAPGSGERQSLVEHLHLPVVGSEELDRGDLGTATLSLSNLRASLLKMPDSYKIKKELEMVHEKLSLMLNDPKLSRKRLSRESLCSSTNVDGGDDEQS